MAGALSSNYHNLIQELKDKIHKARLRAAWAVNKEMLLIYWEIGKVILELEKAEGWGAKTIEKISLELKMEFPDFKGISLRSLRYMRDFFKAYPELSKTRPLSPILQPPAAKLPEEKELNELLLSVPWTYHQVLLKIKNIEERFFYMQKVSEDNWSRNILVLQIESDLFNRQGKAITNFKKRLPNLQSDLAKETLKNPYIFDFLTMENAVQERELERALILHLKNFMLELGRGFAFVGNQYNLNVDGDDFFPDLLFYSFKLQCFVVFEIKVGDFKPGFAGQLNFYVTAIDQKLKGEKDKPTIGVLLCKTPNETVVRFALEKIENPIGVSDYSLAKAIPKELKSGMPTVQELEQELIQEVERLKTPTEKRWENIKQKLADLNKGEIKQTANEKILISLFDNSIKPLYQEIIQKLKPFESEFVSSNFGWTEPGKNISSLLELEKAWKDGSTLKNGFEIQFWHRLNGLKKAGVKSSDIVTTLIFTMSQYWYGFKLFNYNGNQEFIKKMYGEDLTPDDIKMILETISGLIMDDMESIILDVSKS